MRRRTADGHTGRLSRRRSGKTVVRVPRVCAFQRSPSRLLRYALGRDSKKGEFGPRHLGASDKIRGETNHHHRREPK